MSDIQRAARDAVLRVGEVISVHERTVRVRVDKLKNGAHLIFAGALVANTSVGGYVKIGKGFSWLIGKVEGEEVVEDREAISNGAPGTYALKRILRLSLIGYIEPGKRFRRGIKELPLVFNECFLLTPEEFDQIHQFVVEPDEPITLGALSYEPGQAIQVGVNALFASHFGIFGNTGSGKSYTLAKIYSELFAQYGSLPGFRSRARVLLIDFNGEYVDRTDGGGPRGTGVITSDTSLKAEYKLSTGRAAGDRFPLSKGVATDHQLWSVVLEATEKTQAPFIQRAIASNYWTTALASEAQLQSALGQLIFRALKNDDVSLDKNFAQTLLREVQSTFGDGHRDPAMATLIRDYDRFLKWHSGQKKYYYQDDRGLTVYSDNEQGWTDVTLARVRTLQLPVDNLTAIERVRLLIVLKFYDEAAQGFSNREHLAPLIKRLERRVHDLNKVFTVPQDGDAETAERLGRPLQVVSLRDVNLTMRKIIPMLLSKMFYDAQKKSSDISLLNIVVDEAHNILSYDSARETEQWRDYRLETFEEIIKEGRKFGTFLTIASQRPSDISATILSQLHNYFLHRLINERDIQAIERTVSYLDRVSYESIPILPTGSCILAGILAQIPVVLDIASIPLENAPNNQTITVVDKWREAGTVAQPSLLTQDSLDPDGLPLN